ncbi:FH2 domain-containing protein 1-like [Phalacrocorax carbo]|uniref:FH2 domain-containing protein 1-like n=1 Tax=Phalacrocorax carbo TaxID=9209 RepID=UPI00311955D6
MEVVARGWSGDPQCLILLVHSLAQSCGSWGLYSDPSQPFSPSRNADGNRPGEGRDRGSEGARRAPRPVPPAPSRPVSATGAPRRRPPPALPSPPAAAQGGRLRALHWEPVPAARVRGRRSAALLEPKRSLALGVFLKQVKRPVRQIVQDIQQGVGAPYGLERLLELSRMLPSAAELNTLHSSIQTLTDTAVELLECEELHTILHLILSTGNHLNTGGYTGSVAGFHIASLLKLPDTKANEPGMDLLHFVAMVSVVGPQHLASPHCWGWGWVYCGGLNLGRALGLCLEQAFP